MSVMLRVEETTKEKVEGLRGKLRANTQGEVVEKLIAYYYAAERQKEQDRQQREADNQERRREWIYLGADLKEQYVAWGKRYGLQAEQAGAAVLLSHWDQCTTVGKVTLDLLMELRS